MEPLHLLFIQMVVSFLSSPFHFIVFALYFVGCISHSPLDNFCTLEGCKNLPSILTSLPRGKICCTSQNRNTERRLRCA